ncbi:MAG: biopolymer transporter ExbD [Oligoflexia bacterium]|nr:biopolymer transporter ExbD [Oligoflexia bacterium]MBF0365374.1 biopolymer transporter ExbD [Oligoflexia bacterium]
MGFDLKSGSSSMTRRRSRSISDINVTPFVDVVLVLLVIFMLTAPLMYNGIKLELPKTKKVNNIRLTSNQVILSVSLSGEYYIGKEKYLLNELIPQIKSDFTAYRTDVIFLRAHAKLPYGQVAKLMSFLKQNGISNISLVTEIEE